MLTQGTTTYTKNASTNVKTPKEIPPDTGVGPKVTSMAQAERMDLTVRLSFAQFVNIVTLSLVATRDAHGVSRDVRVRPSCKNGSCEVIQRLFETFGREKSCTRTIEQEPFLQWVNSLLPQ